MQALQRMLFKYSESSKYFLTRCMPASCKKTKIEKNVNFYVLMPQGKSYLALNKLI